MKSLSASIVVLAGIGCFTAGAFIAHDETSLFIMFVGGAVGLVGLVKWLASMGQQEP